MMWVLKKTRVFSVGGQSIRGRIWSSTLFLSTFSKSPHGHVVSPKMIGFQVHKRGYFSSPRLRKVQWALPSKGTMKNINLEGRKVTIWRFPENATFQSPFPRQFFSRSLYSNHLGFRGGQTPKKRSF